VLGASPAGDPPAGWPACPGDPPAGWPDDWLEPVSGAWPVSPAVSDGGWGQRSGAGSPPASPALPDGLPDDDGDELGLADGLPGDPGLLDGLDELDGLELPGLPGLPGDPGLPCEPDGGDDEGGCGRDWLVSLDVAQPASASAPTRASPVHEGCLRHIPQFSVNKLSLARPAAIRPDTVGSRRPGVGSTRPAGGR
jgi:hypothetical protein